MPERRPGGKVTRCVVAPGVAGSRAGPALTANGPPWSLLVALVGITALGPMAMQIFLPALPAIQEGLAVSTGTAQLVLSLSTLSIAVAMLGYGPLSDRLGRRPVLLAGLAIYLAGSMMCVLAPDIGTLIVGRIIQAAGAAAGLVLARAIVRDLFALDRAASVMAYLTMAMVTAPMVSPALGGVLTDLLGWRSVFVASGLFGVLVLAAAMARLPETLPVGARRQGGARMLGSFAVLLRSPVFCGFAFQGAFAVALFYAFLAGAPFIVLRVLGAPATVYGLLFIAVSAAFMGGNLIAARLSPRVGVLAMVRLGSLLVLAGTLVLLLVALLLPWSLAGLFVPMTAIAVAQGMSMPNAQAGAVAVAPPLAGAAAGLSGFLQMGLAALVAQLVGLVQDGTPYPMLLVMAVCAAGTVVFSRIAGPAGAGSA